jgi:hypothetical protein
MLFYWYLPSKPRFAGGDELARNEIANLITGMPCVVAGGITLIGNSTLLIYNTLKV